MNQPLEPIWKKDLDEAVTVVMAQNFEQLRLLVSGLLSHAIAMVIAFLLGGVWGMLIVLVVARIIQVFHPNKKNIAAVKNRYVNYWKA